MDFLQNGTIIRVKRMGVEIIQRNIRATRTIANHFFVLVPPGRDIPAR
jgi:hypothetical protein